MKENVLQIMNDWMSRFGEDYVDYHCYFGNAEKFCNFLLEKNAVTKEEIDKVKEEYEEMNQRLFNGKREEMVIQEVFTEIKKFQENNEIFYDLFAEYIAADIELLKEFYESVENEEHFNQNKELLKTIQDFYLKR